MKKIILAQVLTAKGKTEFSGLYDRHGNAVTVEVERDSSGVSLIVWQNEQKKQHFDCGISEEEIQRTCAMIDDCGDCPLIEYCESEAKQKKKNVKVKQKKKDTCV